MSAPAPLTLRRRDAGLWLLLAAASRVGAGEAHGALRVGWGDYPPFQLAGPQGPQGLDVELLDMIAAAAGERLRWLRLPWARQLADLASGELDIICSATHSPDRLAIGRYTQAYRHERVALISLVGGAPPLARLADLRSQAARVGMIRGAIFPEAVRRDLEAAALADKLVAMHANDLTLQALRQRRVDYVIEDPITMKYRADRDGGPAIRVALELAVSPVHLFVSARALQQRPDLVERLNLGLQRARQQPAWAQALARYATSP